MSGVSPSGRRYNWRPDVPDHRDYTFKGIAKIARFSDLRSGCRKTIADQGALGSCTGNAAAAYADFLHPHLPRASRLFIYWLERFMEGTVNEDAGAMIRTAIKVLAQYGASKETLWPYKIARFMDKPSDKAFDYGDRHKISIYSRVNSLVGIKSSLSEGFPVIFGMSVYESFESEEVANTGIVPMPKRHEQNLGGHAVLIVGHDDSTQRVLVRNSWGKDWGQGGYFTLPYAYVSDSNLCDDFWTIRS